MCRVQQCNCGLSIYLLLTCRPFGSFLTGKSLFSWSPWETWRNSQEKTSHELKQSDVINKLITEYIIFLKVSLYDTNTHLVHQDLPFHHDHL